MTSPAAPIDADLSPYSNDVYFVLEDAAIWKTSNLTDAGAATWEKVWDSETDFEGAEFGGLLRIKCALSEGLIYAIGWGDDGEGYKPFCLRSVNEGMTWHQAWIDEEITARDYTVTYRKDRVSWSSGQADFFTSNFEHQRIGDDENTYNPWAAAMRGIWSCPAAVYMGLAGTTDTIIDFSGSDSDHSSVKGSGNFLLGSSGAAGAAYLNDYFGVGGWSQIAGLNINMPKASNRKYFRFHIDIQSYDPQPAGSIDIETWVFWNKPSPIMPKAFDVARSNPNWLYLGLIDKILKSEDGGFNWTTLSESEGAYDICVDPQAAGVIYYWDTEGYLKLRVAGVIQDTMLSGNALDQHGRIARDLNSGKLWVIDASGTLKMRENGSWTDQQTGLSNGRALKAYLGGKLVCLDSSDIYLSTNYGTSWSAKKGGWSEYSIGATAHLLEAAA